MTTLAGPFVVRTQKGNFHAADPAQAWQIATATGEGLIEIVDQGRGLKLSLAELAQQAEASGSATMELSGHAAPYSDLGLSTTAPPPPSVSARLRRTSDIHIVRQSRSRTTPPLLVLSVAVGAVLLLTLVLVAVASGPERTAPQAAVVTAPAPPRNAPVMVSAPALRPNLPAGQPRPTLPVSAPPAIPVPVSAPTLPQPAVLPPAAVPPATPVLAPTLPPPPAATGPETGLWPELAAAQRTWLSSAIDALRQHRSLPSGIEVLPAPHAEALRRCADALTALPAQTATQLPALLKVKAALPLGGKAMPLVGGDLRTLEVEAGVGRMVLQWQDLSMDHMLALITRLDRAALAKEGSAAPAIAWALFAPQAPAAEATTAEALRLRAAALAPAKPPQPQPPPPPPEPKLLWRVNLAGAAAESEGLAFESFAAAKERGLQCEATNVAGGVDQPLIPPTPPGLATVLGSVIWSANAQWSLHLPVGDGVCLVRVWVLENHTSNFRSFDVLAEGQRVLADIGKLERGHWQDYTTEPFPVRDGTLDLTFVRSNMEPQCCAVEVMLLPDPAPVQVAPKSR